MRGLAKLLVMVGAAYAVRSFMRSAKPTRAIDRYTPTSNDRLVIEELAQRYCNIRVEENVDGHKQIAEMVRLFTEPTYGRRNIATYMASAFDKLWRDYTKYYYDSETAKHLICVEMVRIESLCQKIDIGIEKPADYKRPAELDRKPEAERPRYVM